jgi:type II secretory pathway component PulL
MKKNDWIWLLVIAAVLLWLSVSFYLKISVWNECRQANSIWYCLSLLSK